MTRPARKAERLKRGQEPARSAADRTLPLFGGVVAYIRVSSPSQDYAAQRLAIETAARARGELVHHWYADVASGASMDRPQLAKLRFALERRMVQRVWCWRLDRLSRSGIADMLGFLQDVRRSGATLSSVADGFALEGPAAELVCAVLAFAAQLQREQIRENQLAARARMAELGEPWGRPRLPPHTTDAVLGMLSQKMRRGEIARTLHVSLSAVDRIARKITR